MRSTSHLYGLGALAVALACVILAFTPVAPAGASTYDWSGGSDVVGAASPARELYFAEGTTRNGYEEYLFIRNPGEEDSAVTVTYQFPLPEQNLEQFLTVAGGAGACVCVNHVVGHGKDVSIALGASEPVIGERQLYFNYKGVWTGGHVSSGVTEPSGSWYFAEGTTRRGFDQWLCLQNPGETQITAGIEFMVEGSGNVVANLELPPGTRTTVDVEEVLGEGRDASVMVEADGPLVAERSMYFDYKGAWRGGHNVIGADEPEKEWYFAEGTTRHGFEEWLCLMNPGYKETTARIEYMFADAGPLVEERLLPARSRTTVCVNDAVGPERDVSVKIEAPSGILCERPVYFFYQSGIEGGHVVLGSPSRQARWDFATTMYGEGFESWLCLMNPTGRNNRVLVEVRGKDGALRKEMLSMGPHARSTLDLNELSRGMEAPWVRVTGEAPVVAERPVYFAYEPRMEPETFTLATWSDVEIKCPIRYRDLICTVFHEAYPTGGDGRPDNPQAMQPTGECLRDDNPGRLSPGLSTCQGSDPYYYIESTRGRPSSSTTACDVVAKKGSPVYAPVSGTVIAAESYLLYGRFYDLRVRIGLDGYPGYHLAVLHMDTLAVSAGQRVEAGVTRIGTVRDLTAYFESAAHNYSREEGNHPHIQVNYRPDMGTGSYAGGLPGNDTLRSEGNGFQP